MDLTERYEIEVVTHTETSQNLINIASNDLLIMNLHYSTVRKSFTHSFI